MSCDLTKRASIRCLTMVFGLMCPLAAGCGGDSAGIEVQGTVSVNGQPVDDGAITFVPVDGAGKKGGATITDGEYTVAPDVGLTAGSYKVEIIWRKKTGRKYKSDDTGEMVEETKQVLPANFNTSTTLTADLADEPNTKDFSLDVPGLK